MGIYKELVENLYGGQNPFDGVDTKYVDHGYPHTHIQTKLLDTLYEHRPPTYVVECGSMLGGSAIKIATSFKNTDIVCIDPFTGDVNMWAWENGHRQKNLWRFLRLEKGIPTIYKRFLANIHHEGLESRIMPINCTTTVGIKLIQRLFNHGRISSLPNYIYLDSAHEPNETLIEIIVCWNSLKSGSVLFGDDWDWEAVRGDVLKFCQLNNVSIDREFANHIASKLPESAVNPQGVLLYKDQWVLFKK